jgi:hypothetical protein
MDENDLKVLRIQWEILSEIRQQITSNPKAQSYNYSKTFFDMDRHEDSISVYFQFQNFLEATKVCYKVEHLADLAANEIEVNKRKGTYLYWEFQINNNLFTEIYEDIKEKIHSISEDNNDKYIFYCGELKYNSKNYTISYRNVKNVKLGKTQPELFLIKLIICSPNFVSNSEMLSYLRSLSREETQRIREIKSDLYKDILEKNFPKDCDEIDSMIISDKLFGYKIDPNRKTTTQ